MAERPAIPSGRRILREVQAMPAMSSMNIQMRRPPEGWPMRPGRPLTVLEHATGYERLFGFSSDDRGGSGNSVMFSLITSRVAMCQPAWSIMRTAYVPASTTVRSPRGAPASPPHGRRASPDPRGRSGPRCDRVLLAYARVRRKNSHRVVFWPGSLPPPELGRSLRVQLGADRLQLGGTFLNASSASGSCA